MKYIASFKNIQKILIVPKRSCFNNFDLCLCYTSKGGATFHFISPFETRESNYEINLCCNFASCLQL